MKEIQSFVADFSPEKSAVTTGIDAEDIRQLARDFAKAKSAVSYGRMGVSTQEFGTSAQWLLTVLNAVTGNLDEPRGFMFTKPAIDTTTSSSSGNLSF